ncbi:MAG: DUF5106 domain-containing protein [Mucinivorans sp.]
MKKIFLVLICSVSLQACGVPAKKAVDAQQNDTVAQAVAPIKKVVLPLTITDRDEKIEWTAINYWNLFPFADTTYIASPELEQAFVDWIVLMPYVKESVRQSSFAATFNKANAAKREMLDEFMRLAEQYLYDPNSPMRNEEVYIAVLRAELELDALMDVEKLRPKDQLDMALKNRIGQRATDFAYTNINGSNGRLSTVKSELLILFFNDPDCPNCKQVRLGMMANEGLLALEKQGRLKVMAIYVGQDRQQWQNYAHNIPAQWLNVQGEKALDKERLYDLRASPTLYLLDAKKNVILKDCTLDQIVNYLGGLE